jgi:predicted HTH transcriptional regulator
VLSFSEISEYREGNRLEAKKATGGLPNSLWETYSAFANTQGGYILLGVEESADGSLHVVGLSAPEKMVSDFWSSIHNNQKVSANILTERHVQIAEVDGNRIIVIDVPRANRADKPVYLGADPFAGAYRRNGEGDYHCTKTEVRSMMRDQSEISQDLRVLEQLDLSAFDYETIKRYRIRLEYARPEHVWKDLEDIEFLQKLACIGRSEDGSLHPTAGGILMFGYEYAIIEEFSNFFLDYQEHDDDHTRWTDRIVSNTGEWSGNIFDFYTRAYARIAQTIKIPFKLVGDTRIDDTPGHTAIREALVNALIHADYYGRRGLVIHVRPEVITIANPGSLRLSLDDIIMGGVSDPRNTVLIKLFNLLNIGERAGSGVPNIYAIWKNQGLPLPVLQEQFNPDRTILSLVLKKTSDKKQAIKTSDKTATKKCDTRKKSIVDFLAEHDSSSAADLAEFAGISPARVRVYMQELIAENIVTADGANRNRVYKLKPKVQS